MSQEATVGWSIRLMQHGDIDQCLKIWAQVGLTEARQTVASNLSADPTGFYVAKIDETDEVIGMCAGPMTRPDTAFMGFYAVEPKYQSLGIGRLLWSKTVGRLDSSTNVGLYGVLSMSEKYKRNGFKVEDTNRMVIFESQPNSEIKSNLRLLKDINSLVGYRLGVIDSKTEANTFKKLVEYDRSVQMFSREKLLSNYLISDDFPVTFAIIRDNDDKNRIGNSCYEKLARVSTNKNKDTAIEEASKRIHDIDILGYGCIRYDNRSGAMIGPVYADSGDLCEILLRNLMENFEIGPDCIFSAMALSANEQAYQILTKVGLKRQEECPRMFTKFIPPATLSKIYYIHSPNFTLF